MIKNLIALLCLLTISALPASAQLSDAILQLTQQPAVSGNEHQLLQMIQEKQLPAWASSRFDNLGNLIVTIGKVSPSYLLAAAVDEFGHVVSDIRADGYIRIHLIQSIAPNPLFHKFHEGQPIFIVIEIGT